MSALMVERTRHWRTCPVCNGDGLVTVNDSHIGDPQCERDEPCPNRDCYEGEVEVWTDPLIAMSRARRMPWAYRIARDRAMKPVLLPPRRAEAAPACVPASYHDAAMRHFCNALGIAA